MKEADLPFWVWGIIIALISVIFFILCSVLYFKNPENDRHPSRTRDGSLKDKRKEIR